MNNQPKWRNWREWGCMIWSLIIAALIALVVTIYKNRENISKFFKQLINGKPEAQS